MPAVAAPPLVPDHERIARSLIGDLSSLVSPPDVCLKINCLLADERAGVEDLAAVVIRDTSLTARVLKLVNSPFYGLGSRVDTVSRAVMVLGFDELQKIVCALCAVETFSRLSSTLTNMNAFWRHAVYAGLTAQAIARRARVLHPERLFVAGVLHDIGTLVVNRRFPELAGAIIAQSAGDEDQLYCSEQVQLGFDHAQLGALMLESWQLPATICDAIRWHHEPASARVAPHEAAILHVADTLANFSGTGSFCETVCTDDAVAADTFALLGGVVEIEPDALMDEVDRQFVESIYLIVA